MRPAVLNHAVEGITLLCTGACDSLIRININVFILGIALNICPVVGNLIFIA